MSAMRGQGGKGRAAAEDARSTHRWARAADGAAADEPPLLDAYRGDKPPGALTQPAAARASDRQARGRERRAALRPGQRN
jgi:hypothetical protein